jgi:hypothetical protein
MEYEVSGLLGASDEEEWDREGLFKTVDELCEIKAGQRHLVDPLLPLDKTLPKLSSRVFQRKLTQAMLILAISRWTPTEGGLPTETNQDLGGAGFVIGIPKNGRM